MSDLEELREAVLFMLKVIADAECVELLGADGHNYDIDHMISYDDQQKAVGLINKISKIELPTDTRGL